jgi:hypothetical protein
VKRRAKYFVTSVDSVANFSLCLFMAIFQSVSQKKSVKSAKSVVKMFVVLCHRLNDERCHSERSEESPLRWPDASLRSA